MHHAAGSGHIDCLEMLLERDADVEAVNKVGTRASLAHRSPNAC